MRPHYVLGSFKYWCALSFSFLQELCNKNIIIYISFRWRNNLCEVRKFARSHTTRMWGNGSFWLQSSYFSPFPTSPLLQQSPWIANATCHCLHHCLWALEGIWWLWFQDCDPTAQYRVCCQVPNPKSVVGVNCSICRNPAWKVKAVSLSSLYRWDRPAISSGKAIKEQVLPPWGLADVSWGHESISASCQFMWLLGKLVPWFCWWECQQPPLASPLEIALKYEGQERPPEDGGPIATLVDSCWSPEGPLLSREQDLAMQTSSFVVCSSFENRLHHLLNLWPWGKFLNFSKARLLHFHQRNCLLFKVIDKKK